MKPISYHKRIGYPQWSVITTIAITLFMIGLFSLFAIYAGKLTDILKANIDVQVYVNRNILPTDSLLVQEKFFLLLFRAMHLPAEEYQQWWQGIQDFFCE